MKTLLSVALTVCAMLGLCRPAAGDMIIDVFTTTQSASDTPTDSSLATSEIKADEVIGGVRYIDVTLTSGAAVTNDVNIGSDAYKSIFATGSFSVGYDNLDDDKFDPSSNPEVFDLSDMQVLSISAYTSTTSIAPTFGLLATLYEGVDSVSKAFTVSSGLEQEYRLSLAQFVNDGIDLANVIGIKISSNPNLTYVSGQSVTLTDIRTLETPEPSSMILLTLTGMGFAGTAWRRHRKQALAA